MLNFLVEPQMWVKILPAPKLVVPNCDLTSSLNTTGDLHIVLDPISDLLNKKWEWGPP